MNKISSLSLAMILILSSTITVVQELKPDNDYISISDYNNAYQQSEDDNMLSLDDYNQKYER